MNNRFTIYELIALWPQYIEGEGSGSNIVTAANELLVERRSSRSLMRRLLQREGVELSLYRKAMAHISPSKQSLPIVFGDFVFMTFKARRARVRGDETYGYVRIDKVETIRERKGGGEITLVNGVKLATVDKAPTLKRHMSEAALLKVNQQAKAAPRHEVPGYMQNRGSMQAGEREAVYTAFQEQAATGVYHVVPVRCCPAAMAATYPSCQCEQRAHGRCPFVRQP